LGNKETRNRFIEVTKRLLMEGNSLETLTARHISSEAGVNLAMINYCFKSKDELLKIAVEEIVAAEFNKYVDIKSDNSTAKEQLRNILYHVCKAMLKYSSLTRISIPYIMLNEEISLPYDILPFIKKHYEGKKDETQCKVIAFHIVYTMQLIFYRSKDFYRYSGIDVDDEAMMEEFLDSQLDLFLGSK